MSEVVYAYALAAKSMLSGAIDWTGGDIRLALLGSGYMPNPATEQFWSQVMGQEIPAAATTLTSGASSGATSISTAASVPVGVAVQVGPDVRRVTTLAGAGPYTLGLSAGLSTAASSGATVAVSPGYTTGGKALTGKTAINTAGTTVVDADDVTWASSTLSARWGVLYNRTPSTDATRPVIAWVDLLGVRSSSAAPFTVAWNPAGILTNAALLAGGLLAIAAGVTASGALPVNAHSPVDATSGAATMTLPTGQPAGTVISVEKTDSGSNAVIVSGSIRGSSTTISLTLQHEVLQLATDQAGSWWPLAGHKTLSSLKTVLVTEGDQAVNLAKQAGVDATGVTECAAAIQTALTAAAAAGIRVFAKGTYKTASTITITGNADMTDALINYSGTGVAVQIGDPASTLRWATVRAPRVIATAKTITGWSQVAGSAGVRVSNCYACQISVPYVNNFESGFLGHGQTPNGTSYCSFFLGHLDNNKVDIAISPQSSGSTSTSGWFNQNKFFVGRCSHNSSEGSQVSGTRSVLISACSNIVNGNNFDTTSLESPDVVEYHIECYGQYNTWNNARFENSGGDSHRRVYWRIPSKGNVINLGFNSGQITQVVESGAGANDVRSDVVSQYTGGGSGKSTMVLENFFSSAHAALTVMAAGANAAQSDQATAWAVKLSAAQLEGKRTTDSFDRVLLDFVNGQLSLGPGSVAPTLLSVVPPDLQTFHTPGTFTWTKPTAGQVMAHVYAIGGGPAAGSGRRGGATTVRCGGGPGGGGGYTYRAIPLAACSATETVIVGAGGTGGAAVTTDDTNGNAGTAGTASSFGTHVKVQAGTGGAGGTATTGTAGAGGAGSFSGGAGGTTSTTGGVGGNSAATANAASGGGAGGGITTADVPNAGGNSGIVSSVGRAGSTGAAINTSATAAADSPTDSGEPGPGGGGGGASITGVAGDGAHGALYGGGGGGGGASLNGNNSGKGGDGANGIVIVFCT